MSFIGHTPEEEKQMLADVGIESFETILSQIPAELQMTCDLNLDPPRSEAELRRWFGESAARNYDPGAVPVFLGGGIYDHDIPAAIDHLLLRSEFYTAYTPYQAEVSQGTLAAIFEFQTMICGLTGMDVANASMYDGASAAAEAALLAISATRGNRILLAGGVNPRIKELIEAYLGADISVESLPLKDGRLDPDTLKTSFGDGTGIAAILVQQPNFFGLLESISPVRELINSSTARKPAHLIVSADILSLGLLQAPGEIGADTVVGDLQPLGIPVLFGGPTAGYFATAKAHIRKMPGRIVGETVDSRGARGFTLTLQTREQHIRREKATSNICTNSAANALRATIFMSLLGPAGLKEMAGQNVQRSSYAAEKLVAIDGVERAYTGPFFREFVLSLPANAEALVERIFDRYQILAGIPLSRFDKERPDDLLVAVTEKRTRDEIDTLAKAVSEELNR